MRVVVEREQELGRDPVPNRPQPVLFPADSHRPGCQKKDVSMSWTVLSSLKISSRSFSQS